MLTRRGWLAASAAALASGGMGTQARAQAVTRPVKVVIGFPAGGGTDVIGRVIADKLQGPYATTAIVENKPGAASRLSVDYVKGGDRDGTMMLFTPDFPLTIYPHSFKKLSYDPERDLTAIAPMTRSLLTFNVGPAVPESVKSVPDFLTWCKAQSGKGELRHHLGRRHTAFHGRDAGVGKRGSSSRQYTIAATRRRCRT